MRSIVKSKWDALVIHDLTGAILYWNQGAVALLGRTPEELALLGIADVIGPRSESERRALEGVLRGERATLRSRRVDARGKDRAVVLELSPIRDRAGQVIAIHELVRSDPEARPLALRADRKAARKLTAALHDTEQKLREEAQQAREELRRERERFEKTASTSPGVLYSYRLSSDGSHCFPYTSERMNDLTGFRPEQLVDDATPLFERILPDDVPRLQASIAESARNMSTWQAEYRMLVDGEERWLEAHSAPEREPSGAIVWHGVVQNVTARKRAEEAHLGSQKLEALGTLAGGIAHDFNNLLLAISGHARLASMQLSRDHDAQPYLAQIEKAVDRATELVERILAFGRPKQSKRAVVDIRPVLDDALRLLRATVPTTIAFRSEVADDLPPILGDAGQVHQCIVNLTTNAVHAIGKGGVITFKLSRSDVSLEQAQSLNVPQDSYVCLEVTDSGRGMRAETLRRVFDPFFTTKAPGEGTGLGLSLVHRIMQDHRGVVTVKSRLEAGSTFCLFFPVHHGRVAPVARAPTSSTPGQGQRILLVDDEEMLVSMACDLLAKVGYRVRGVCSPVEAMRIFNEQPDSFDAVVTDLAMPTMSGLEFTRGVRATRPNVPVLLLSGNLVPEDIEAADRIGVRRVILKPRMDEVLHALRDIFRS